MGAGRLKYFLIIACLVFAGFRSFAQPSILKKEVSVSFDNISVEKLLIYLSNEAGFNFSYNSEIININDMVSYHGRHVPLEDILKSILPDDVDYSVSGDYLILVKEHSKETRAARNTRYEIKGYIYDARTGHAIANVSVVDATGLESALSDSTGFYDLVLNSKYEQINLYYSKKNFLDTLIIVQPADHSLNMLLRPEPVSEKVNAPERIASIKTLPVESHEFVRKIVSREQIIQSENVQTTKTRFAQLSLWPKVGTNLKMSGFVNNNLSLNVLAGYARGVNGVEVGGLANIDRNTVRGFQVAGLANIVGGWASGVQIGGLININSSGMTGLQVAGINNVLLDDIRGVQISGINNVLKGSMKGAQFAGINNFTSENVNGLQVAGISNIAWKDVKLMQVGGLFNVGRRIGGVQAAGLINLARQSVGGFQLAGLANATLDSVKGFQMAGLANFAGIVKTGQFAGLGNIATKKVNGVQVAGLFNYGKKVNGGQLGFLNVADSVGGIPVGFISLVRKGYHKLEISAAEVFYVNVTLKLGVRRFYNIFTAGFQPSRLSANRVYGVGYGIGTQIGQRKVVLNLDFKGIWVKEDFTTSHLNISYRFNPELTYYFTRKIALFIGPALVLHTSSLKDPDTGEYLTKIAPETTLLWKKSTLNGVQYQLWAGGSFGLRFF